MNTENPFTEAISSIDFDPATWCPEHVTNRSDCGCPVTAKPRNNAPATQDSTDDKVPAATRLVKLAEERYRLAETPTGEAFAVPLQGPPVARLLRGGGASMRADLAGLFYDENGRAPSQQALADAMLVLEGKAARAGVEPLHMRVAEHDDALWLDLGDDTGKAIKITPTGWTIELPPILFRRTALTGPLPEPIRGGSLDELWPLLNVAYADRPLVLAILTAQLIPDIPHPVVLLTGEQGTGKSTATRTMAALLDPSPAQLRQAPRDVQAWTTAAVGSWVVAVDNLSGMPIWLSEAFCRASTGDGDVRRKLYSDGDLHVLSFRRCIIINGIDLGSIRDDLADRAVPINLDRITHKRQLETDLAELWSAAHPRVLAAVLDLAVKVLAALPDVKLTDPPRMADFARIIAAVDQTLNTTGLDRYRGKGDELAADAVSGDPVLAALTTRITTHQEITAADLLGNLTLSLGDDRPPRDWPKDARTLGAILKRRAPSLRRIGWVIEQTTKRTERGLLWKLTPPPETLTKPDETADETISSGLPSGSRQDETPDLTCTDAQTLQNPDGMTKDTGLLSLTLEKVEEEEHTHPPQRDVPYSPSSRHSVSGPTETDDTPPVSGPHNADPAGPPPVTVCVDCNGPILLVLPGRTRCAGCERTKTGRPA